jgi:hypothetical protein
MAKVETFTFNRPNFLASEVGLVLKTGTINKEYLVAQKYPYSTDEKGNIIVEAGTVYEDKVLFQDVELDGANTTVPFMVAGYVYSGYLKNSDKLSENSLIKILAIKETTRPEKFLITVEE